MKARVLVEIYVSCAIHTEKQVLQELLEVKPFLLSADGSYYTGAFEVLELVPGGIRLNIDLIAALQLNFWLKTAHRILIRLAQFKAQSWPEIRDRLKKVDLKAWLKDESFEIQIDAEKCRVSNEKYLRKMCAEIWSFQEEASQKVFLRGQNDFWTLSLDSTGEHLHRRGIRKKIGEAPLRETLAALTLRLLVSKATRSDLSEVVLLDPMAGSGTFLLEGRDLYSPVRSRDFSFVSWPRTPALLKSSQFWKNYPSTMVGEPLFKSLRAIDQDQKMKLLNEEHGISFFLGPFKSFQRSDLNIDRNQKLWLISNPPYGRRIENLDWISEFWGWWPQVNPTRAALWIPRDLKQKFLKNAPLAPSKEIRAINGGISCEILLFGF